MSISITLSHEIEALEALQDEWIDLQNRSSANGATLAWQWIYTWYKHFSHRGELWLLTAFEDGQLIGIAPLMNAKEQPDRFFAWRQIQFIGAFEILEHLDFIIESGYEKQVIPLFIDKLYEHRSRWDVIRLTGLYDTNTSDILQQSGRDWVENARKNRTAPYMALPDTMDEWMLAISRNHRQKMRRYYRKMDEQFPDRWSITQVTQPDELDYTLDHLVRLHQAQWESVSGGNFHYGEWTEYFRELMHSLLENGWLRLYRLDIDDKTYAVDFCWHYGGRAYYAIGGLDRDVTEIPLGYILMQHTIEQAISEGLDEYTFMWGEFAWKFSFGGVNRVHHVFELVSSPRVQAQLKTVDLLRGVKSGIRQMKSNSY